MGLNKDLSLLNIKSQNQTSLVVSSYLTTRPDSRGLRPCISNVCHWQMFFNLTTRPDLRGLRLNRLNSFLSLNKYLTTQPISKGSNFPKILVSII